MTGPAPRAQTAVQPRPPNPPEAPDTPAPVPASAASRASMHITGRGSATTPRRLRVVRLALTIVSGVLLLGGVATAVVLSDRQAAAEVHATQFVRAGSIESDLLRAHTATASSLLQSSTQAATAQQELAQQATDDAARTVVELSSAGVDDVETIASITQGVLRYNQTLAQAQQQRGTEAFRATLSAAHTQLTDDLLPQVNALQDAHRAVSTSDVPWWMWLLPVVAWLGAFGILAASWYVARTSHRVVNAGLAAALIATGALAIYSGQLLTTGDAGGIGNQFGRVESLTSARQSAIEAEALLTNGVAVHSWKEADRARLDELLRTAEDALAGGPDDDLQTAAAALTSSAGQVRQAATSGDWAAAEKAVTSSSDDSLSSLSASLLEQLSSRLGDALTEVRSAVRTRASQIAVFGVIAVLCAAGAGLASIAGIHQRLKDYR